jgi:hypothetical protein
VRRCEALRSNPKQSPLALLLSIFLLSLQLRYYPKYDIIKEYNEKGKCREIYLESEISIIMKSNRSSTNASLKKINALRILFWDYNWNSVKKAMKSPFVMARVLELANPQQFMIFARCVGHRAIHQFLIEKGQRLLSSHSFNFWMLYYQNNEITCSA